MNPVLKQKNQTIKYKYALDPPDEIISIDQVDPSNRSVYSCISCGGKLVAVLGEKRQRHFRHAVATKSCSLETYLHYVGKFLFYETYQSCVRSGRKYEIELMHPKICTHCELVNCKLGETYAKHNLTDHFKEISLEHLDGNFIPDLLLSNKSGERVYIELAVTHKSSPHKISSGIRIIEIALKTEDDFELLTSCVLSDKDSRVKFMNFTPAPVAGNLVTECRNTVSVFILNKDGSADIREKVFWHSYENHIKGKECYCKIVQNNRNLAYLQELERVYLDDLAVKNCFLCRHHRKQTINQLAKNFLMAASCEYQKKVYDPNHAVGCSDYRPDKAVFRFSHH